MSRALSILSAFVLALMLATVALAQDSGRVNGEILDKDGKPYADVTVSLKNSDTGQTYTIKTDKNGKFVQLGMRGGPYLITSTNAKDNFTFSEKFLVSLDKDNEYKLNVKEVLAESGPSAEEVKKREEEQNKFKDMKVHFDNGIKSMAEANDLKTQLRTATTDQKSALQEKRLADCKTAITEFTEAEQGVTAKEVKNHALVWANLGSADECAAKYDDAIVSFQKAIDLAPAAGYYTNLATNEADAGAAASDPKAGEAKFSDASAACDKAIALDPASGATCWKNLGIVLSNKGRMKEAVLPLQKASQADPKDQLTWYMLGSALANTMDQASCKEQGGKLICVPPAGTTDSYQKCIDAGPDTSVGKTCKEALDGLISMSGGQDLAVGDRKKKK